MSLPAWIKEHPDCDLDCANHSKKFVEALAIAWTALEEAKVIVDVGIVQLRVKTAMRRITEMGK